MPDEEIKKTTFGDFFLNIQKAIILHYLSL